MLWVRALADSLRNGAGRADAPGGLVAARRQLGPRCRARLAPAGARAGVRRSRPSARSPIGLGMFAVVYTAVQKILIDPMPYKDPGDLYYVWRDYGPILDLQTRRRSAAPTSPELQKASAVIESAAGAAAIPGRDFLAARRRRSHGNRGDARRHRTSSICSASRPRSAAALRRTRSARGASR